MRIKSHVSKRIYKLEKDESAALIKNWIFYASFGFEFQRWKTSRDCRLIIEVFYYRRNFFKSIYSLRIPLGRYRLWNSLSNQCLHKASTVYTFNDDNCRDRYFNRHCCIMTQLRTNTRGLEHKRHNSTICVGMYESDIQSDSRLCILFNSEINIESNKHRRLVWKIDPIMRYYYP